MWSFVVSFSDAVADTKARSTLPGAFQERRFRIALEGVGLVGTAQQVLSHNPLEIFFLALDAVPRAPVCLDRQECDDRINIASLDNPAALRSLELVEDVVVDIVDVVHRVPRL
jgi:hypothetical protein